MSNNTFNIFDNSKISLFKEIIPAMESVRGQTIVIKCGNKHMSSSYFMENLAWEVKILQLFGAKVIIVHGGGDFVKNSLKENSAHQTTPTGDVFIGDEALSLTEMSLRGKIAPLISSHLSQLGIKTINISGRDNKCIIGDKIRRIQKDEGSNIETILDIGLVGDPSDIDTEFIDRILQGNTAVIVSPILVNNFGKSYVTSADNLASFMASSFSSEFLFLLADENYISANNYQDGSILGLKEAESLLSSNESFESDSQCHKLESAIEAVKNGVGKAIILNGNMPSVIFKSIYLGGLGTSIVKNK